MTFTRSTVSFAFFGAVFVLIALTSSVFIVPLLVLSFIFSGFVVVFSGLSYVSFRLASSKYNHTVLFLNKLLRRLADNIPPSVGLIEVPHKRDQLFKLQFLDDFKTKVKEYQATVFRFKEQKTESVGDVHQIGPNAPIIYDEDDQLAELSTEAINGEDINEQDHKVLGEQNANNTTSIQQKPEIRDISEPQHGAENTSAPVLDAQAA